MGFKNNELVIIKDAKGKSFIQRVVKNGRLQTHLGTIYHKDIIGKDDGADIETSTGNKVNLFYPTLNDYIQKMAGKTAIIHPKDIAVILLWADIKQRDRIVEAGTGSGALLMALVRFLSSKGHIYSYDNRPELQQMAVKNIEKFYGKIPKNVTFKNKDITTGIEESDLDAVILDFSQPWDVIPEALKALKSGGKFVSYIPTIIQAERLVKELQASDRFMEIEILEVLLRPWQIKGYSVRPHHRMVGHTGFMVFARLKCLS